MWSISFVPNVKSLSLDIATTKRRYGSLSWSWWSSQNFVDFYNMTRSLFISFSGTGLLRDSLPLTVWESLFRLQFRHHWWCFHCPQQSMVCQSFCLRILWHEIESKVQVLWRWPETVLQEMLWKVPVRTSEKTTEAIRGQERGQKYPMISIFLFLSFTHSLPLSLSKL